jgi:hypothetical protein
VSYFNIYSFLDTFVVINTNSTDILAAETPSNIGNLNSTLCSNASKLTGILRCTNIDEIKRWVGDPTFNNYAFLHTHSTLHSPVDVPPRLTQVQEITTALHPSKRNWTDPSLTPLTNTFIPPYPYISSVSRANKLNRLQHVAFDKICSTLLNYWKNSLQDINYQTSLDTSAIQHPLEANQLLMQLPGPGGVGKSTVLHAVTEFCRMWQQSDSFLITATTGKVNFKFIFRNAIILIYSCRQQ